MALTIMFPLEEACANREIKQHNESMVKHLKKKDTVEQGLAEENL